MTSDRIVDRTAGWLGVAFLVTLLVSEAVLSLPDEHATASAVAQFYAAHRAFIIVLQIVGMVGSALLAACAWRLRRVDPAVGLVGIVLAVVTVVPGLITLMIAIVADPNNPTRAGSLNKLEPRGDDALFVGVVLLAAVVAVRLWRRPLWLGILASVVAVCCLLRLVLEAVGATRGLLETFAPVAFLLLIAALSGLAFYGYPPRRSPDSGVHFAHSVDRRT
jgi:hypothetical protein